MERQTGRAASRACPWPCVCRGGSWWWQQVQQAAPGSSDPFEEGAPPEEEAEVWVLGQLQQLLGKRLRTALDFGAE